MRDKDKDWVRDREREKERKKKNLDQKMFTDKSTHTTNLDNEPVFNFIYISWRNLKWHNTPLKLLKTWACFPHNASIYSSSYKPHFSNNCSREFELCY